MSGSSHEVTGENQPSYLHSSGSTCLLSGMSDYTNRTTRPCHACGGKRTCRWVDDAWICSRCGSEWYPDHAPEYAIPGSTGDTDGR